MKKAAAISLVLVTLTLCLAFLIHMTRREAGRTAQGAIQLVRQALNITPQVTISTYVSYQKTSNILELASVKKEFPIDYFYENTTLGSTKRLHLHGHYTVKAGFDLRERFDLQVNDKNHRIRTDFPAPKILSVQQNDYKVVEDTSGYWNLLNQQDQEACVNGMNDKARASALKMNVLEDAKTALRTQLLDLAKKSGQQWDVTFRDETIHATPPPDENEPH